MKLRHITFIANYIITEDGSIYKDKRTDQKQGLSHHFGHRNRVLSRILSWQKGALENTNKLFRQILILHLLVDSTLSLKLEAILTFLLNCLPVSRKSRIFALVKRVS